MLCCILSYTHTHTYIYRERESRREVHLGRINNNINPWYEDLLVDLEFYRLRFTTIVMDKNMLPYLVTRCSLRIFNYCTSGEVIPHWCSDRGARRKPSVTRNGEVSGSYPDKDTLRTPRLLVLLIDKWVSRCEQHSILTHILSESDTLNLQSTA